MPHFLDNRGRRVVPSLQALAIVADGITEDQLQQRCPALSKHVLGIRRRLRVDGRRWAGQVPVFLSESLATSPLLSSSPPPMDYNSVIIKSWTLLQELSMFLCGQIKSIDFLDEVKEEVMAHLPYIKWIHVLHDGEEENSVTLASYDDDKIVLRIGINVMRPLFIIGLNLSSVRHLVVNGNFIKDPCLQYMIPNLRSLCLEEPLMPIRRRSERFSKWKYLAPLCGNLRELRLSLTPLSSPFVNTLFMTISKMKKLQLIWISIVDRSGICVFLNEDILSRLDNPELRSVGLHCAGMCSTKDVIRFLTKQVPHEGKMVARQHLMEDLTLAGFNDPIAMNLYDSPLITQRMKERIYTDPDKNHEAAALLNIMRRKFYVTAGSVLGNSSLYPTRARWNWDEPVPGCLIIANELLCQMSVTDTSNNIMALISEKLVRDVEITKTYDKELLLNTLSSISVFIKKRHLLMNPPGTKSRGSRRYIPFDGPRELFTADTARLLFTLHQAGAQPSNVPLYLEDIVILLSDTLRDPGSIGIRIGILCELFVEYSHSLSPAALKNFYSSKMNDLYKIFKWMVLNEKKFPRSSANQGIWSCINLVNGDPSDTREIRDTVDPSVIRETRTCKVPEAAQKMASSILQFAEDDRFRNKLEQFLEMSNAKPESSSGMYLESVRVFRLTRKCSSDALAFFDPLGIIPRSVSRPSAYSVRAFMRYLSARKRKPSK